MTEERFKVYTNVCGEREQDGFWKKLGAGGCDFSFLTKVEACILRNLEFLVLYVARFFNKQYVDGLYEFFVPCWQLTGKPKFILK